MSDRVVTLIPQTVLAGNVTVVSDIYKLPFGTKTLAVLAKFVRAAGGGTLDVYIQTSLDGGATWMDIMNLTFGITTANQIGVVKTDIAVAAAVVPADAALTDDTILDGVLGDRIRCKYVAAGTAYSGASHITVTAVPN